MFALDARGERRELRLEEYWPHKGLVVLKFAGVDSISDAEALVGSEIQLPRGERAELEVGEYVSDLVGCEVFDRGRAIGRIEDVQFGAGDAPLLQIFKGSQEILVPFAEEFIAAIDIRGKRVEMKLPAGILEVNAPLSPEEKREAGAAKSGRRKRDAGRRS